jgi:hypothetical protein
MRSLIISMVCASSVAFFAQGCAAEDAASDEAPAASEDALTAAKSSVLNDVLMKAKAPATNPGITGVGAHAARILLTTAQGGMAHFISQGGSVSTLSGEPLANVTELGIAWSSISDALTAGGAKFTTIQGAHGASSSKMLAKVDCSQIVVPGSRPTCNVAPITLSEEEANALMDVLRGVDAPSTTAPGIVGIGSRAAKIELTFAQGGAAHFISESGAVSTPDGKPLGSLVDANVAWQSVRDALLDSGLEWTTTQGAHGSSSSKMSAQVECSQVVAPAAKPICIVSSI